jgi:hypothetical protein
LNIDSRSPSFPGVPVGLRDGSVDPGAAGDAAPLSLNLAGAEAEPAIPGEPGFAALPI